MQLGFGLGGHDNLLRICILWRYSWKSYEEGVAGTPPPYFHIHTCNHIYEYETFSTLFNGYLNGPVFVAHQGWLNHFADNDTQKNIQNFYNKLPYIIVDLFVAAMH